MSYNTILYAEPTAQVKAIGLTKRINRKKEKLDRYGPNRSLEREIKQAELLLDDYLIKAAYEALATLKALQDTLDEYDYRKAEGYLTDEQIDHVEALKSYIGTMLSK